ncbi:hypothetical protein BGZ80_000583 [Entomortierella chlamydospora]|uniref:Uncharacterized protein n=1 Tax=Entomortierella chlamydospora TaxID=101097 RepID=A0A9P6SYL2_9FUNG|nr:hypothetical protein BGZ79_006586 [Entomortierella chlamydospora]KAG0011583.1 hypothetical protein BGZ80_000583 [Entomortierella chlamydospora]
MGKPDLEPEEVVPITMVRELQPPMSEVVAAPLVARLQTCEIQRSAIEPERVMDCRYVFESESPLLDEEDEEKEELAPHHHYAVEAAAIPALAGLVTYEITDDFVEPAMSAPVEAHF